MNGVMRRVSFCLLSVEHHNLHILRDVCNQVREGGQGVNVDVEECGANDSFLQCPIL